MLKVLLIGPNSPAGDKYCFNAPPLGIWRICGFLRANGIECDVFDPNLYKERYVKFQKVLNDFKPDVIGFSITSMTLPYDISLIHWARRKFGEGIYVAGGIGATFEAKTILENSPVDYCVAGEGEVPMLEICRSKWNKGYVRDDIPGLIYRRGAEIIRNPNVPLTWEEFEDVSMAVPYDEMRISAYWNRMLKNNGIEGVADEELKKQRLGEVYSIRLMTKNHCPMGCSFCSYTNFLNFANRNNRVGVIGLRPDKVISMIEKLARLYPQMRTLIFQDDNFYFKDDRGTLDLLENIIRKKREKAIPGQLAFIASNRIDFIDRKGLSLMKDAGFRVIGYGVESFSRGVLLEFGKEHIYDRIDGVIEETKSLGIKPFLDIILSSPNSTFEDVIYTMNKSITHALNGCEVSIYPVVIPLAGSRIVSMPEIMDLIQYQYVNIPKTKFGLWRGTGILPKDEKARKFLEWLKKGFEKYTQYFVQEHGVNYFPSRVRSLIYGMAAADICPDLVNYQKEEVEKTILSTVTHDVKAHC